MAKAKSINAQILARLEEIEQKQKHKPDEDPKAPTVLQLWDLWFVTMERRLSAPHIRGWRQYLLLDCELSGEKFRLSDLPWWKVSHAHLAVWMTALATRPSARGRTLKVNSRNVIRNWLQISLSYHVKNSVISRNPLYRFPRESGYMITREEAPTPEQLDVFLKACGHRYAAMLMVSYRVGGLRKEEVRLLKKSEIDHETQEAVVINLKHKGALKRVYIPDDAYEIIKAHAAVAPGDYIWYSTQIPTQPVSPAWMYKQNNRARQASGMEWTPHNLRHAFARHAILKGVDLNEIATQMGHTDPTQLLKTYNRVKGELATRRAREKLNAPAPRLADEQPAPCASRSPRRGLACQEGPQPHAKHRCGAVVWGKKGKTNLIVVRAEKARIAAKPVIPLSSPDRHLADQNGPVKNR